MRRFLIVVHQLVPFRLPLGSPPRSLIVCSRRREPLFSSTTPSVTMNSISCGVSPGSLVPLPGSGMELAWLSVWSEASKLVATSPPGVLVLEEHAALAQLLLFEDISITPKFAEAVVQPEV